MYYVEYIRRKLEYSDYAMGYWITMVIMFPRHLEHCGMYLILTPQQER